MTKKTIIYFTSVLVCCACVVAWKIYFRKIWLIKKMEITAIDLKHVPDGIHNGCFDTPYSAYTVDVLINDHQIKDITIHLKDNFWTYYDQEARSVIKSIITTQRTNVDVVSGATVSSKAILKAVENAVSRSLNQVH